MAKPSPKETESKKSEDPLRALMQVMQPLIDFHGQRDEAARDDLRIFWDVRVVRGNGEMWNSVSGSSTLPSALSVARLNTLATLIQDEIESKIAAPLVSVAQEHAAAVNLRRIDSECEDLQQAGEGLPVGQGLLPMASDLAAVAEAEVVNEP